MSTSPIRDTAKLTITVPVDGTPRRRGKDRGTRTRLDRHVKADDRIMDAIVSIRRPGERVKVVSETEVWLVPRT